MMLAYVVVLAVVVGYARGGRLRHYEQNPLRLVALPIPAFLIEALYDRLAPALGMTASQLLPFAVALEYALLITFCAFNIRRKPIWWVSAGTLSNLLVISQNGFRMPISTAARHAPDMADIVRRIDSGALSEYMIADDGARLLFLGDVIHIPFLPGGGYASVGDFMLGIGIFLLVAQIMRGERQE